MTRRGWVLFIIMSVIWGMPYLLIRIAVREVSPATLIFFRTLPAGLLLLPLALYQGGLRDAARAWRWIALFAAVELGIPWLFVGRAEIHLTSSLTGLLIATVPLTGAVIYRIFGIDRFDRRRIAGLVIGFLGVVALLGIDAGHAPIGPVLEVIIPAVGYSLGPLTISKKLGDLPGVAVMTIALLIAGVAYAPFGLTHLPQRMSPKVIAAVAGLALITTALAFVLFFELIGEVGPARSTVITYINPAVAIVLGVVVLGEPFTVGILIGFPLILAGSWLATAHPESTPVT